MLREPRAGYVAPARFEAKFWIDRGLGIRLDRDSAKITPMRFQAPRGTKDILPAESHRWQNLESTFREVAGSFGYAEIRTPTFEDTALFTRAVGETTDIVSKEMYTFLDRGERSITLKPEGTAPAIRAVVEHSLLQQTMPLRLYYITSSFRYERPQAGRLRELHQVGLELIGSESPTADAEIIEATVQFYRALGLTGVVVHLNSLGTAEDRTRYRELLLNFADSYLQGRPEDVQIRANKNPLRMLDFKDPEAIEVFKNAPLITDSLSAESTERFRTVQRLLTDAGIAYEVRPGVVRGLDYYSHTVFEIHSDKLGAQSQICGGGRYDGLVKELGGPPCGCIGVGVGVERTLMAIEAEGNVGAAKGIDVYVAVASPDAEPAAAKLLRELRSLGLSASRDVDAKQLKAQFKQADRFNASLVAILGEEELARGEVTVKTLATGAQSSVSLAQAALAIQSQLRAAE